MRKECYTKERPQIHYKTKVERFLLQINSNETYKIAVTQVKNTVKLLRYFSVMENFVDQEK